MAGVALPFAGAGALFVADANNNRIRKVNATTFLMSTYAGNGATKDTVGNGGPATQAALKGPMQEAFDSHGDIYIADAGNNRVQEIAAYSHAQYGITMTGGDVYTIAGSPAGVLGCQCGNPTGPATAALLNHPWALTVNSAGDLYIADYGNSEVEEIPAANKTQWGQTMTAGQLYGIAGGWNTTGGTSGDRGPASAAWLHFPEALVFDPAGDLYIADSNNNRIQEIYNGGAQWGQSMTVGDIYTVAGAESGTSGNTGDGGPGASALLSGTGGLALDTAGDLYIGDGGNNRVQELAATSHTQWGQTMTAGDIYTVTGGTTGVAWEDGSPASGTQISAAQSLAIDSSGDLYIADQFDNRIEEIANITGTQWGQSMTAGDEYTVAGSFNRTQGNSGDGGPATSALMSTTESVSTDPEGDLYITDNGNGTVREVASATANAIAPAPGQTSALVIAPAGTAPGGITVTQPGGAQVTFWPKTGSPAACAAPYVAAGDFCTLPENINASLTYNSSASTYTYVPVPGITYTYSSSGALQSEADPAGDTLVITYNSPAPGATVAGNGTCPAAAASCETVQTQTTPASNGRALVLGWSGPSDSGFISSVTDPMNRTWTYAYNASSQLTSATDPMGHVTSYTYGNGGSGNLQLANDLLTVTDPNGQPGAPDAGDTTVNVYDTSGRVTSQTDPQGFVTTFDYSGFDAATGNGVVRVTDPDHNVTTDDYLEGTLVAETASTGSTISSERDFGPQLLAGGTNGGTLLDAWTMDGNFQVTRYSYDSAGDTTTTTDPLGNQTTQWSTSLRQPSCSADLTATSSCSPSQTGPAAVAAGGSLAPPTTAPPPGVTFALYTTSGRQLYSTTGVYQPGSSSVSSSATDYTLYSGNTVTLSGSTISCASTPPSPSLPCATISSSGVVTQIAYDPQGDLASISRPDGNGSEVATTTYTYNADGEQLSITTPDGNLPGANSGNYTKVTAYNADGLTTSVTQGGGPGATVTPRVTSYGYDPNGNATSVTDQRGYTTITEYDADNAPTLVTDPMGNKTLTCYDGDGNPTQKVPPAGVAASNLTPANCPTTYQYPSTGYGQRLASDATTWTYDVNGNKTAMTTPAPVGQTGYETDTYTYDSNGSLLTTTSPSAASGGASQVTLNSYDADGRLTSQTTGYGSSTPSTTSYCYDLNGNKTSVVPPDGNTAGVAPCESASPWVVSAASYPTQASFQTTYSYDSAGDVVSSTSPATTAAPGGATTSYTYDANGNVVTAMDPTGTTVTRSYNSVGRLTGIAFSASAAHSVSYTYDAQGAITGLTDATGSSAYSYNPFGELR